MKLKSMLTAASLALTLSAAVNVPAYAHAEHGKPQFGGIVAEAGEAQFEVVGSAGKVRVHVTEHGAPLDTAGATGKLTVLAGTQKQEIALKPAGTNLLEGEGQIASGAKLLLQVQLAGKKPLQARAMAH